MANPFILLTVFVVFAQLTNAQKASCPSGSSICYCQVVNSGIALNCDAYYSSAETIRAKLEFYKPYGPISFLQVNGIGDYFNYIPDDFLAGNQIPEVKFTCSHGHSTTGNMLMLSSRAFTDSADVCGLTGNVTFADCNMREFDATGLTNCDQLRKLAFMDSHVDKIRNVPTLDSLTNFTVYSPSSWNYASQKGLSQITLAPGASLANVTYLDLTGNSLRDDSIEFVPQLRFLQELRLEGNNFTSVVDLTHAVDLHTVSMTLNSSATNISISLPNPRSQSRPLFAKFYSASSSMVYDVALLEGFFIYDTITFYFKMDKFQEDVFLSPLQSNGLTINLNSNSRITCGCEISWLIRDNRPLLGRVNNGICMDGRSFADIPLEEVSCCSTDSLLRQISFLRKENDDLKVNQNARCSREEAHPAQLYGHSAEVSIV
ncbi:uncharacterized protein LOC130703789 [Daphnia carinata]|uniref:uncharacterized protein LOC130703789 n=1 Tax=Daphnia carinata TaxID=120202 RepID=UPI002580D57C|nr:uncharacterized protein LOC130703789 [Daphnia carinata]